MIENQTKGQEVVIPAALVDLAAARVGGKALLTNDEFFAKKENLLKPSRGIFIPDKYTDRGKWMDGWETRRRRTPGNDWCVIRLGLPGIIKLVDIDTNHFIGNHPPHASLDAVALNTKTLIDHKRAEKLEWVTILPKSPLNPGSQNLFEVANDSRWTHVRLNIYPDGGVARLRVYGAVVPDWDRLKAKTLIDLVAIRNGGVALACSDMFFSSMNNIIMPGRAKNMGDGWETKRRRGQGNDWIIIKLGTAGIVKKIEVDTNHFKGNYPDMCSIEGCYSPDVTTETLIGSNVQWREILTKTKLRGHTRHFFQRELKDVGAVTHVWLNIYPDGGVSRLRVYGTIQ